MDVGSLLHCVVTGPIAFDPSGYGKTNITVEVLFLIYLWCVCRHSHSTYVEVTGQLVWVGFLFPPHGTWRLYSGRQTWQQAPVPAESSQGPHICNVFINTVFKEWTLHMGLRTYNLKNFLFNISINVFCKKPFYGMGFSNCGFMLVLAAA